MTVRVRLFASLAERAGWREQEIELGEGDRTLADVLAALLRGPLLGLPAAGRVLGSRNHEHVPLDAEVRDGDEVGFFPPVSGGAADPRAFLTDQPLCAAALADLVRAPSRGAVVTFEGTVRDLHEGEEVIAIDYEAYPEMAEPVLRAIREEVEHRWPGTCLALAHRTGRLAVGTASVAVACGAPHRRQAFAACRMAMDRIKESLPAWKRQEARSGSFRWL